MEILRKWFSIAIIHLFNFLLPVKENKIFFFSYYGNQYGCNPKYISEHMLKHYPKDSFDIVWALNNPSIKLKDVKVVKTMSLKYFYELCTSKVIITNFRTTELFVKRKNQYYIQTWHSSLRLKQIEKDAEASLPSHYVQMAKRDSKKCDLVLSGCKYSTSIFKRAFWYEGEIFEHGTPRNDMLINNYNVNYRSRILNGLKIAKKSKVILYAPTFRKGNNLEIYKLEFSKILSQIKNKYGGEWVFLVKLHPHLSSKSKDLVYGKDVIDVTAYDDIQELLSISDVLITDYSSLMFDFALTKRPCFLYVPDLDEYMANDRNLYFDIQDLPFNHATDMDQLLLLIQQFNNKKYEQKLKEFSSHIGTYENGKAAEKLVKHIHEVCFKEKERKLYEAI
ncbi:CDP-glycerol glycerophosphotransferase family protein [Bacillus tianshenii]|nr:CDP-glycerol glycerophosphotransferase family protein [Bacillus tianshenii]